MEAALQFLQPRLGPNLLVSDAIEGIGSGDGRFPLTYPRSQFARDVCMLAVRHSDADTLEEMIGYVGNDDPYIWNDYVKVALVRGNLLVLQIIVDTYLKLSVDNQAYSLFNFGNFNPYNMTTQEIRDWVARKLESKTKTNKPEFYKKDLRRIIYADDLEYYNSQPRTYTDKTLTMIKPWMYVASDYLYLFTLA